MSTYHSVEWVDGKVRLLDQRQLPHRVVYLDYEDYHELAQAIRDMVIRGAPAIGTTAAYGLALATMYSQAVDVPSLRNELAEAADVLRAARTDGSEFVLGDRTCTRTGPEPHRADTQRYPSSDPG